MLGSIFFKITKVTVMAIYRSPKTLYHNFINAYAYLECSNLSKQDALLQSNKKWKEAKNDKAYIQTIISSAPKIEFHHKEKTSYKKWVIYKDPKTLYHKFINAYVKKEFSTSVFSRQEIVLLAIEKWKDIRKESAKVEAYIAGEDIEDNMQMGVTMVEASMVGDESSMKKLKT